MSSREPRVRLERFEKQYGNVVAVGPVDLVVRTGESFALLGPNGSGKTTILRAIVGLHAPTRGRVVIGDVDVALHPDRARADLSYVPQRVTLPDMLTAREVLTLFARLRHLPAGRVDEVLDLFALADDADRRILEFSGGMVQRLGLAVAFLGDVGLFVLDEPTVNLDLLGVERFRHLIRQLKRRGTTIVFSTHLLQTAVELADRVAVLAGGKLARVEDASSFRDAVIGETAVRVVLREATGAMLDAATGAGAQVSASNGNHLRFRAAPERRLEIIRAIEKAGGIVEEFHTEAPDWEALIRHHFGAGGDET